MKKYFLIYCLAFIASTLIVSPAFAAGEVYLNTVKGDVKIVRQGEAEAVLAQSGDSLGPGDRIITGQKASAEIAVGKWGEVNLEENTTWSVENYSETEAVDFSSHLALGRLKAKLKKLPRNSSFKIETPTAVAAVRGTFFGLWVYELDGLLHTFLEVFDETVNFSGPSGSPSYDVDEGETSTSNEDGEFTPPDEGGEAGEEGEEEPKTVEEDLPGIPGFNEEGENVEEEPQEPEEEEERDKGDFLNLQFQG